MAISKYKLEQIIKSYFPDSKFTILELSGEDNYSLEISDKSFNNLSLLEQHMLVKQALKDVLQKELHAITIKTLKYLP